ncbi:cellulose binding domain-containing protein [Phytohabitans rumicis]|uniref:Cellulose-binding protein II n=1 Tax=Phytohabitans rumicis TaxID=1076125 RepID=A0A6V8LDD3_9ACTN|nr:cellulose binding domain-containing protein [Phytohabitans rumicis]GFJ94334.1 cellulose-binding protein II [Phytohabitans rumicis]
MKRRVLAALSAAALLALSLVLVNRPAGALTVPEPTTSPAIGNSTYFDGLGSPYGGCGLPQAELETQDFVALNVYDTPRDYNFYPRPVTDTTKIGIWNNGLNCGRWVQVKISDFCTGVNDGAPNQAFCRNGSWVADAYNDAVLNMLVADSCGDANAWCRDDPYHLDLSKASLNRFVKNGAPVGDLLPNHYNNRHVSWSFVPAPNYTGDIQIGFLQGAQRWWPAISVSRLANGIHGVEYFANGAWQRAQMNGDMGQSYVIGGTASGGTQFQIRVRDITDTLINGGRVYNFTLPDSCSSQCSAAYTRVSYTTSGSTPTSPPPSSPPPSSPPPSTPPPSSSPPPAGGCAATYTITSAWNGGYQADVTVRNNGTAPTTGWTVTLTLPGTARMAQAWSAVATQTGQQVTATNQTWNGTISAGGTTSFGMIVNGPNQPATNVSCTSR